MRSDELAPTRIASDLLTLRELALDAGAKELAYLIDMARLQALAEVRSPIDPAPTMFHWSEFITQDSR